MTPTLATIVGATGGQVFRIGGADSVAYDELRVVDLARELTDVIIDSRQAGPGSLFVALPGTRSDGHEYVTEALAAGARGVLVSNLTNIQDVLRNRRESPNPTVQYLIVIADPLTALQSMAREWRQAHNTTVAGITGSVGKTTTKEIVTGMLEPHFSVLASRGNFNTEIGLPLTMMQLRDTHDVAVLEMGMYDIGDIALLAGIATPQIGIVTNVAPVHLERAGSIERVARAKSELIAALPQDGLAILNGDDPWTVAMATSTGLAPWVTVGLSDDCEVRAEDVRAEGLDGVSFTIRWKGERVPMRTMLPGKHLVPAFLSAVVIARRLGIDWEAIQKTAPTIRLRTRQRFLRDADGVLVIDDTYNAGPMSMHAALDLLEASSGSRIAVLGDMLELGPDEETAHREIGNRVAQVTDWLVVRGPRARWMAQAAEARGLPADHVLRVGTNAEATAAVRGILGANATTTAASGGHRMQRPAGSQATTPDEWTVLIKGSRGMEMEEIVQGLRPRS